MADLVKTIEDDDDVPDYSEPSDDEEVADVQPTKKNKKAGKKASDEGGVLEASKSLDFDEGFDFAAAASEKEYLRDSWKDVAAYVKSRRPRTTVEERIRKIRKEKQSSDAGEAKGDEEGPEDDEDDEQDDDDDLSEDELVHDNINVKKAKKKIRQGAEDGDETNVKIVSETNGDDDDFFEELEDVDKSATFYSMNLSRPLLKAIDEMRFAHPTPIQAATIPVALAGRDVCGCAATGTGKTAAYMLPILERLLFRPRGGTGRADDSTTRVLLLVPTRELGVQVFQVTKQLCRFTNIDVALSVGGLDLRLQEAALRKNPDIVIATPGRLIDHLKNTPSFGLDSIEVLILDEADRLLEEAFIDQLKEIVRSCAPTRQTMLFSATMTDQVNELAAVSLRKPVKIFVDSNKTVAGTLQQEFVRLRASHEGSEEALLAALMARTCRDHAIVFIRTKKQCHRLHIVLGLLGLKVAELHGNMSQAQRLESLKMFKEEEIDILLTTDVAARGLDISGVKTVVNFELPDTLEQYIHRVGRTARAGRAGRSVSFARESNRKVVREIVKSARRPVKSRVIPANIIDKYCKKVQAMEADVARILEEERVEREIAMLENRANRMQNQLQLVPGAGERAWMEKPKKKTAKEPDLKPVTKKRKKLSMAQKDQDEDPDMKRMKKDAQFFAREAKRARKPQKIRTFRDNDDKGRRGKGGGTKKSHFSGSKKAKSRKNR